MKSSKLIILLIAGLVISYSVFLYLIPEVKQIVSQQSSSPSDTAYHNPFDITTQAEEYHNPFDLGTSSQPAASPYHNPFAQEVKQ